MNGFVVFLVVVVIILILAALAAVFGGFRQGAARDAQMLALNHKSMTPAEYEKVRRNYEG
jgi:L-asparagine transporter-like permease